MALKLKNAVCLLLPFFLQSCAIHQGKVNSLAEGLEQSGSKATLHALTESDIPDRDRAQYLLNIGLLKSISGDFLGGTEDLETAKNLLSTLQAVSVSEVLGAATINETLRSYDGSPSERILLHQLLSMNYLMQNDLDAARVEVLQAAVVMDELATEDELTGQLASGHYTAGLVYELSGELDNAMISYRKAERTMAARNMRIPRAFMQTLVNLSQYLNLDDEYDEYHRRFSLEAESPDSDSAEIIVLYWDGVVTSKTEKSLSVWVPSIEQMVSLAMPTYPSSNYVEKPLVLDFSGQRRSTTMLENVEVLAREDLARDFTVTFATTLARAVAKAEMVKNAAEQNANLGLLMNLATLLTESADIRSWNMLPSSIQVARFSVPPSQYSMPVVLAPSTAFVSTSDTGENELTVKTGMDKLTVKAGDKIVLFASSVSRRLFAYTLSSARH